MTHHGTGIQAVRCSGGGAIAVLTHEMDTDRLGLRDIVFFAMVIVAVALIAAIAMLGYGMYRGSGPLRKTHRRVRKGRFNSRARSSDAHASVVMERRLRMPIRSRIVSASAGVGRRSRRTMPSSSPSCVTVPGNTRLAFFQQCAVTYTK